MTGLNKSQSSRAQILPKHLLFFFFFFVFDHNIVKKNGQTDVLDLILILSNHHLINQNNQRKKTYNVIIFAYPDTEAYYVFSAARIQAIHKISFWTQFTESKRSKIQYQESVRVCNSLIKLFRFVIPIVNKVVVANIYLASSFAFQVCSRDSLHCGS